MPRPARGLDWLSWDWFSLLPGNTGAPTLADRGPSQSYCSRYYGVNR